MNDQLDTPASGADQSSPPNIHNGTYTVTGPKGGHFTVKVSTVKNEDSNFFGKRIVSVLTGPNNENDYTGVAFLDDKYRCVSVWKRFIAGSMRVIRQDAFKHADPADPFGVVNGMSRTQVKLAVWLDLVGGGATSFWLKNGGELRVAGTCCVCNRKLTDPVSIDLGIGPHCRGDV